MKKLIVFLVIVGGAYYYGKDQGWFEIGHSEPVASYKKFMDSWIVRDYDKANQYASGNAADEIKVAKGKTTMKFMGKTIKTALADKGIVEKSGIKVISEEQSGGKVKLSVVYSASISWPGMTANPMSPGSWRKFDQTATLDNSSGTWKVVRFNSEAR